MTDKIVCIGDSITYGFPYGPGFSWVALVARATGFKMVNRGENGDTTGFMAYRFKRDVLALAPSHVIIMGGTNDAYVGESLEAVAENIRTMARKAISANALPILGLPIPSGDKLIEANLNAYRKWMQAYAAENRLGCIDFAPAMTEAETGLIKNELYMDDVHPSIDGYDAMAEVVQGFLLQFLKKD